MLKQTVLGTAVLAVALAIAPTTAHAQQPYYGDQYGTPYNNGYADQNNYSYEGRYDRDRYLDHEARERREHWARIREMRERERRERARHYYEEHSRYGYPSDYGYRR